MSEFDASLLGFDPERANLTDDNLQRDFICYLTADHDNGHVNRTGLRIGALFTILITSTLLTMLPIWATRTRWNIPPYLLLFARYTGAGVIIATAFIHLLVPAFEAIGPNSCVGLAKGWKDFPWPAGIIMVSFSLVFLMGYCSEWFVEQRYGHHDGPEDEQVDVEGGSGPSGPPATNAPRSDSHQNHQFLHSGDQDALVRLSAAVSRRICSKGNAKCHSPSGRSTPDVEITDAKTDLMVRNQIISFLVLEFGVLFHSVIIGLNLGVTDRELPTLFPVVTIHQALEGLGIGARLSIIPFSKHLRWIPWAACVGYGVTTPIAIAVGMALSNVYNPGTISAQIVSGVLDSISAGILLYTGIVELLARDFLFNSDRTRNNKEILFMLVCMFVGMAVMALLGRWA